MEVAGQWRREWAGTAEYGKVIEGGVTRRVARAMEVLQASGPGARVRVLRAAYHSTAGPGKPASSFMIHSSRRVISSGSSFLESPTFPTLPLEISSMPLESSPERSSETDNYKVTEPDDTEASQPSKWKGSTSTASIRLPSEESSSVDNASIVDVDTTMNTMKHINFLRKSSLDSDISDSIQSYRRNTSRVSPLLDTPVTLSTLKYKSLLNGNNSSWNDRRKSYSFEDTSPIHDSISKDTLGMESSTDSGICKSTEKVNENDDTCHKPPYSDFSPIHKNESRFQDWLASNRPNKLSRVTRAKTHWEEPAEYSDDNVSLQSKGKFSIALQQNNKTDDKFQYLYTKNYFNEFERKIKKVEFSKTELHFAAESGKVNIISTDDKPPPSSDFRRRRSAFVPLKEKFERPITLFGEKSSNFTPLDEFTSNFNESNEIEESTVSAKSILKNKIPKPKPYLLGENMEFRETDDQNNRPVITSAVSLINSQLQKQDFRYSPILTERNEDEESMVVIQHPIRMESRAVNKGQSMNTTDYYDIPKDDNILETKYTNSTHKNSVKHKLSNIPSSPVSNQRAKTRHLRDSDLTYFGVGVDSRNKHITELIKTTTNTKPRSSPSDADDYFRSVKLVQQVSNSVSNSEAESEDTPEYQNIPFKAERMPVPTPKPRSKYFNDIDNELSGRVVVLKPIIEQDTDVQIHNENDEGRRSRSKRNEHVTIKSRSNSEPPKYRKQHTSSSALQHRSKSPQSPRSKLNGYPGYLSPTLKEEFHIHNINSNYKNTNFEENPIYMNVLKHATKQKSKSPERSQIRHARNRVVDENKSKNERHIDINTTGGKSKRDITPEKHNTSEDITRRSTRIRHNKRDSNVEPSRRTPVENTKHEKSSRPPKHEARRLSPENDNRNSSPKRNERSRSSQRRSPKLENYTNKRTTSHDQNEDTPKHLNEEIIKPSHVKTQVKDQKSDDRVNSLSSNTNSNKAIGTRSSKEDEQKRTRDKSANLKRREYVINYDDKNGTMSSVFKVKSGTSKTRTVHPAKEAHLDQHVSKGSTMKLSLKYQDQHLSANENCNNHNLRTIYKQRTCTII